ncbi:MAG: phytoene desaturase family protein [Bacteroidales bacterium]
MRKSVLIVGSGIAGLASALRLNTMGYDVTLVEKNNEAGGRLNRIQHDGFTFDGGPTFFSMSYEFDRFVRECGINKLFSSIALDPLYKVNLQGYDEEFILNRNIHELAKSFKKFEPGFEDKMKLYLQKTERVFKDTINLAVRQNFHSFPHYLFELSKVNKKHLPLLASSYSDIVNRYFDSDEARQIISLPSYFLGSTPEKTNGIYSLLSYTEFIHDGYHNVKGGMYEIVIGMLNELKRRNIPIIYNTEINGFKGNGKCISALIDKNGNSYQADHYLINMDAALFRGRILNRRAFSDENLLHKNWSMGFLTIYAGIDQKLENTSLHNYYIGKPDPLKTMKGFQGKQIPENPYFYVNIPSKYNLNYAPEGKEAVMFVVPVPNLANKKEWNDTEYIIENILKEFSKRTRFQILKHLCSLDYFTPFDWQNKYNLFKGAGLGMTHCMSQTGYMRTHNEDETYKNLFYTGSSTVPGIGLPMAIISSRLSVERILKKDKINIRQRL